MRVNEKGTIHLFLPIIAIIAISVIGVTASNVTTTTRFSATGILGENEIAKQAAEQTKEATKKAAEQAKESAQKAKEQESSKTKTQIQTEGTKQETEIETSNGQKIKTKIEDDDATKVEIEQKDQKIKFEAKNEQIELEIEDEEEASGSGDDDNEEGLEELRSISKFPLRIDPTSNQLIMSKNGEERVLTILPAKAVQNMLRAHLKKGLGPKFFEDATPSATPSATPTEKPVATESADVTVLEDQISLEETEGQITYKIPAKKKLKLLGFIPVTTDFTSFVSAETGALIKEQESLLSRILDALSP